jgi:hypothetical protein
MCEQREWDSGPQEDHWGHHTQPSLSGRGELLNKLSKWSPAAPIGAEVTIEGDEVYNIAKGENLSRL